MYVVLGECGIFISLITYLVVASTVKVECRLQSGFFVAGNQSEIELDTTEVNFIIILVSW